MVVVVAMDNVQGDRFHMRLNELHGVAVAAHEGTGLGELAGGGEPGKGG